MSYAVAYFSRADEILGADIVTASAEDSEYPAANLLAENAANPAKLTTTTGNWVIDFGSARAPVVAALIYQYIDAALEVRLQGNAADSWGAPSYNQTITIPAKRKDGPSSQRWTRNASLIITGSPSYRYWRLIVVGTNSQAVAVGRLVLATGLHVVDLALADGKDASDDEGVIVQPTELGVETVYALGGPRRRLSGVSLATANAWGLEQGSTLQELHEASQGVVSPFLFFPFGLSAEPWLVRFESAERRRTYGLAEVEHWPFAVREVSRGLPWP